MPLKLKKYFNSSGKPNVKINYDSVAGQVDVQSKTIERLENSAAESDIIRNQLTLKLGEANAENQALISEHDEKLKEYEKALKLARDEKVEISESCKDDSVRLAILEQKNANLMKNKRKVVIAGIEVCLKILLSATSLTLKLEKNNQINFSLCFLRWF